MWKTLLRCGIVGGITAFLWLTVSWTILPLHKGVINRFANESEIVSTIAQSAPRDGIYLSSYMGTEGVDAKEQTFVFVNIKRGVDFANMARPMAFGVITQIIAAMLVTYLLLKTKAMKYWNRVWFVTLVGVFAALVAVLPSWNWWSFSTTWVFIEIFDLLMGWFLAGLVIAKLIKD